MEAKLEAYQTNDIRWYNAIELLTRYHAAALVEVRTGNSKRQLVIASGYFPGDAISPPPEEVQGLIEWCQGK